MHHENGDSYEEFQKVAKLVKPFITPSTCLSLNMQLFHDQFVEISKRFGELEKGWMQCLDGP